MQTQPNQAPVAHVADWLDDQARLSKWYADTRPAYDVRGWAEAILHSWECARRASDLRAPVFA